MDRWTWMIIRLYAPALACVIVALLGLWWLRGAAESPLLAGVVQMAAWIPKIAFGLAALIALVAGVRLWRWEQGEGLLCHCGGLLGRERPGVRGRTDYRRCLACDRAVSSDDYA